MTRPLSARELDVVVLIAADHTLEDVAARLFIARSTARSRLNRAAEALGVERSSRVAVVVAALRQGHLGFVAGHPHPVPAPTLVP